MSVVAQVTRVFNRIFNRPYAMAFEQWTAWFVWDIENSRHLAMTEFMNGWGSKLVIALLQKNHAIVVRESFSVWKAAAQQAHHCDSMAKRAQSRNRILIAVTHLSKWKAFTAEARRARKFTRQSERQLHCRKLRCVEIFFRCWTQFHGNRVCIRKVIGRLMFRLRYHKIASAWAIWSDTVNLRKQLDVMRRKSIRRLNRKSILLAFSDWCIFHSDQLRLRFLVSSPFSLLFFLCVLFNAPL
jgi:hypothetical protein